MENQTFSLSILNESSCRGSVLSVNFDIHEVSKFLDNPIHVGNLGVPDFFFLFSVPAWYEAFDSFLFSNFM